MNNSINRILSYFMVRIDNIFETFTAIYASNIYSY